jgi:protein-S-isoprenylcysteine O-methyltransferase Ste14
MSFLGFTQIKNYIKYGEEEFKEKGLFELNGALKYVRHPYYFSGLVLIWARPLKGKDLVVNIVFTIYFILGALNEERKLVKYFGNTYKDYQKKVPMLIPVFLRLKK